jgi:methylated-DNA-[protein]-cysteine S-methyltransferase
LAELCLHAEQEEIRRHLAEAHADALFEEHLDARSQILEYFAGSRRSFDLRLDMGNIPPFSRRILEALVAVPFGATITYGELAARAGRPGAARAVGRAMAANPLPIVVPCHRVVGAGGKMTGYSGGDGIVTKRWLLRFEEAVTLRIGRAVGEGCASVKNS